MKKLILVLSACLLPTLAYAQASPNGTRVPPAASITDGAGRVWTLMADGTIWFDGKANPAGGTGVELTYVDNVLYAVNQFSNWYRWTGDNWTSVVPNTRPLPLTPTVAQNKGRLQWGVLGGSLQQVQANKYFFYPDNRTAREPIITPVLCIGTDGNATQYSCSTAVPAWFKPGKHNVRITYDAPESAKTPFLNFVVVK